MKQNKGWKLKCKEFEMCILRINIVTQEQFAVQQFNFEGAWEGNQFRGELYRRTESEVTGGNLGMKKERLFNNGMSKLTYRGTWRKIKTLKKSAEQICKLIKNKKGAKEE